MTSGPSRQALFIAALASGLWFSATLPSNAYLGLTPGETAGVAFGTSLPEGIFAADLESYGQRDVDAFHSFQTIVGPVPGGGGNGAAGPAPNINVNLPALIWSTPVSFYDTRLELLYSPPVVSLLSRTVNETAIFSQSFGPILAHDFANGISVSLATFVRPPSPFQGFLSHTYADLRVGLSYVHDGYNLSLTFAYTGTFGGSQGGVIAATGSSILGNADAVNVDFTATKKLGRFEFGLVGYAFSDINTRGDNSTTVGNGQIESLRAGAVAVGPLVGYDFGPFIAQAYVLRQVAGRNQEIVPGLGGFRDLETRGYLRLVAPLYIAPFGSAPVR